MQDDHELDYVFDLMFDIKTYGEIKRRLEYLRDHYVDVAKEYSEIREFCIEHGIDVNRFPHSIGG